MIKKNNIFKLLLIFLSLSTSSVQSFSASNQEVEVNQSQQVEDKEEEMNSTFKIFFKKQPIKSIQFLLPQLETGFADQRCKNFVPTQTIGRLKGSSFSKVFFYGIGSQIAVILSVSAFFMTVSILDEVLLRQRAITNERARILLSRVLEPFINFARHFDNNEVGVKEIAITIGSYLTLSGLIMKSWLNSSFNSRRLDDTYGYFEGKASCSIPLTIEGSFDFETPPNNKNELRFFFDILGYDQNKNIVNAINTFVPATVHVESNQDQKEGIQL